MRCRNRTIAGIEFITGIRLIIIKGLNLETAHIHIGMGLRNRTQYIII